MSVEGQFEFDIDDSRRLWLDHFTPDGGNIGI